MGLTGRLLKNKANYFLIREASRTCEEEGGRREAVPRHHGPDPSDDVHEDDDEENAGELRGGAEENIGEVLARQPRALPIATRLVRFELRRNNGKVRKTRNIVRAGSG